MKKSLIINLLLTALITLTGCQSSGSREETLAAATEIDQQVDVALQRLYDTTPSARMLARRAKGILVFPGVVKAGFIGGVKYGTGALREEGRTVGYYNIVGGSWGLQAGVKTFDYALFFMTQEALDFLNTSSGWQVGVGPSVVVVDAGVAKSLTTTTARDDVYAFIFGQQGLMAGMGIQGSKITRVNP